MFSGPPSPSQRIGLTSNLALLSSVVVLAIYSFIVGAGLMSGTISAERGYLLTALPCLVPAVWFLVGFLRFEGRDYGLVFSSVGWFFAALTLFLQFQSTQAALSQGLRLDQAPPHPTAWLSAFVTIACLLGGVVLSGRYWLDKSST